ncbi:uncharacterized protein LOC114761895 [Neltuma alba]|uniref:uncharacterized protein LOC114761895 n=1 Tax=Neltuma alba TaxID=207710 RepID=UPI0010A41440|nr:uncharacterized protein LOC114761895 [Prosopis alba]
MRFEEKCAELRVLLELLSDAKNVFVRIDEADAPDQLVEQALLCKSYLREIANFTSAILDSDLNIISQRLTIAIKFGVDSGALSIDKVSELIAEGENLLVNVDEDLRECQPLWIVASQLTFNRVHFKIVLSRLCCVLAFESG